VVEITPDEKSDKKITILMADDHPLFRKAVRDLLEKHDDFKVVAEANDGEEAVRLAVEVSPDVVIMDISMPRLNGLDATREIKVKRPESAVLVLTIHNDIEHILSILEAGAAGYLTKSSSGDEVIAAIRSVVAGETVIANPIFHQVLRHTLRYSSKPLVLEGKDKLTARELEVLKLAARGLSNRDIAQKLNLSLRTVKGYMVDIFSKLHVSSRTEAVITGLRAGLISPTDIE
jgi:NarL family two-component system response regulator LiaR